jgi:hypothetical protein
MTLALTGSTGHLGGRVAAQLSDLAPILLVRDASRAPDLCRIKSAHPAMTKISCIVLSRSAAVPPEHERGQCTGVLSRDHRIASSNHLPHQWGLPRCFYFEGRDHRPCEVH